MRRGCAEQEGSKIPVGRKSVLALRCHDDQTAGRYDLGGSGHALDGLVEVLVEGVPSVCGDHDRKGVLARNHGRRLDEGTPLFVCLQDMAAEEAGDLVPAVQGDVYTEVHRENRTCGPDLFLGRISFESAPGAPRVPYDGCPVVGKDGVDIGQGREDPLVPAGIPCEEVGLDKPEDDPPVCVHVVLVHVQGLPVFETSHRGHRVEIVGVVVHDLVVLHDPLAEHPGQFLPGVRPVGSGSVDHDES